MRCNFLPSVPLTKPRIEWACQSVTASQPTIEKPEAKTKACVDARGSHVAPKKVKAGKKASPAKKAPKRAKESGVAREGTKAAKIIDLLKRSNGATLAEIMKATGWQAHSVRGFLSTAGKKHRLKIESTRTGAGERTYKIAK